MWCRTSVRSAGSVTAGCSRARVTASSTALSSANVKTADTGMCVIDFGRSEGIWSERGALVSEARRNHWCYSALQIVHEDDIDKAVATVKELQRTSSLPAQAPEAESPYDFAASSQKKCRVLDRYPTDM